MRKKVYKLEYDGNQLKTITDDFSEFKISNAYMILKFRSDLNALSSCSIFYKDEENGNLVDIDTLTNIQAGQTFKVNVFEMMKSIQSKKTNLFITFSSNVIDPDADNKLVVERLSLAEYQENGSSQEIEIGKAGTLSINLLSGIPILKTNIIPSDNNKLSLAIDAIYNGVETELPNSLGLPNNWKLNVNQFLIKDKDSENLKFTYVDENGNSQIIEEKYYYIDENNKKVFIGKESLSVNLDGQLIYKLGDKEYNISTKLEAPSGIKLVSSIKDVQGSELVDYEPEELSNVKVSIKQLKENIKELQTNIEFNKGQVYLYTLNKNLIYEQMEKQKEQLELNRDSLDLQDKIEKIRSDKLLNNRNYSGQGYVERYLKDNDGKPIPFTNDMVEKIYKYFFAEEKPKIENIKGEELTAEDVSVLADILLNESNTIYTLGVNYDIEEGTLKIQHSTQDMNEDIYETEQKLDSLIEDVNDEYMGYINANYKDLTEEEKTNKLKAIAGSSEEMEDFFNSYKGNKILTYSLKDLISIEMQIDNLIKTNETYQDRLSEYQNQLKKYEYQKDIYEMQVPVHYLYSDNDVIYGFGKTSDENIFRLILITDSYENMIFISYDSLDDNKIRSISNSKEQLLSFNYKDNKMTDGSQKQILDFIIDYRDRKVNFDNEEGNLETITLVDGTQSYYYYVDNKLTYIINQNGMGSKISYTQNSITAQSLSGLQNVASGELHYKDGFDFIDSDNFDSFLDPENKVIITCDGNRTSVTNEKNKILTYVFDVYGNTRFIYQSDFNSDENSTIKNVQEFNYTNNRKSEKISGLPYSENYLSDVCFNNESIEMVDLFFPSDDVYCGDGVYSYQLQSCDKKHTTAGQTDKTDFVLMSDAMLAKLEDLRVLDETDSIDEIKNYCSHRTFMVSGFAKASSLFVVSDDSDDYAENVKARKFAIEVKVTYADGDIDPFEKSFDWTIKNRWQYCSVPVTLKDKEVSKVECRIDYSNNNGDVEYSDLQFRQATIESVEYDSQGRPYLQKSGHSEWEIKYDYDEDTNNVTQKTYTSKISGKSYVYLYTYNKNGKLLRTEDVDRGIIEENVYDDNGNLTKTMTYHKDEPAVKFYQEQTLDENGNVLADKNEFGKETSKYEYVQNTGLINTVEDENGDKVAYGYDADDTLVNMTTSVDGINNTNVYGYNMDFLTSIKHNGFAIEYDYDGKGRTTKVKVAGVEYLDKAYDELTETTHLASGEKFKQTFDSNGNVLETRYFKNNDDNQGTLVLKNIYDTQGNVVKTIDENGVETKFLINNFGQTYKTEGSQHSQTFSVENTYDDNHDKVTSSVITIGGEEYTYCYSYSQTPDTTLENIELPNNDTQWLSYDKLGRISNVTLGLTNKEFSYYTVGDHTSNLISKLDFAINGLKKDNLTYKYDAKGNIIEIRRNNSLLARYKYDSLSRIVREDNKNFNKTYIFTYDEGGNITSRTEYDFTLVENLELLDGIVYEYTYPVNGWKDQVMSYTKVEKKKDENTGEEIITKTTQNFEYDAIGNPTTYRNKTLTWSHGRRLDKFADIASYTYNASGIRTKKIINIDKIYWKKDLNTANSENKDITLSFYLNGNKILRQHDSFNNLDFYYGADGVIGFNIDIANDAAHSGDYYYKKNAQNDIIGIYSTNGTQIVEYVYDAWGNQRIKYLNNQGEMVDLSEDYEYNNLDEVNAFIAIKNPFRYRSYYYDFETNLYYLNSRYYDPQLGRFINADDISILSESKVIFNGLNVYIYCGNNPINYFDPSGKFLLSILLGLLITSVTVAVVNVGVQLVSDVVNFAITGKWKSSWEDYVGAFAGGLIGGATFFLSGGNLMLTFAVTGSVETLTTSLLTNATGRTNYSALEIIGKSVLSFVSGFVSGLLFGGTKIAGMTIGRNSLISIWKSGLTKLFHGVAKKMGFSVVIKGLISYSILKSGGAFIKGILSGILDWFFELALKKDRVAYV